MEFTRIHGIGIIFGAIIMGISFLFLDSNAFLIILGSGILVAFTPFLISLIKEAQIATEKEEMFLEFARNLVESVKAGTPISKSIVNVRNKPYGVLSENVQKLANQISLGISLNKALVVFAKDINNKTVSRAITLIGQAERAGGDIGEILESVAEAVSMSDKLKKERKSAISTLVVQGYIIFIIFMAIILIMQFKILPMISGIADINTLGSAQISTGSGISQEEISNAFLYLLLIQGLFSGITIGKLAEGNIKAGVKHSFALMLISFLVSAAARLFI